MKPNAQPHRPRTFITLHQARTICDDMTLKIADIFDNQLIKHL